MKIGSVGSIGSIEIIIKFIIHEASINVVHYVMRLIVNRTTNGFLLLASNIFTQGLTSQKISDNK